MKLKTGDLVKVKGTSIQAVVIDCFANSDYNNFVGVFPTTSNSLIEKGELYPEEIFELVNEEEKENAA
jgi:hypothetical protein